MSNILIMHQTIAAHDAIGNDIEIMFDILNEKNECVCFAENRLNNNVIYIDIDEAKKMLSDSETIVIYHHSIYWALGEKLICNANKDVKVIFRYHNITPPEFFEAYDENAVFACNEGRKQTDRLLELSNEQGYLWLADSNYNCEDLTEYKGEISIVAPFNKIEEWTKCKPDDEILNKLVFDKRVNLMFVGRLAPNKGHKMLVEILNDYIANYGDEVKLYIIGKPDGGMYSRDIQKEIQKYGLQPYIEFVGEINDSILMAYYLGSDIFLCTSDHEGFCVPIIEAQMMELPVIAKKACAVPDTVGENQVVLGNNTLDYVAAIKLIQENSEYRNALRQEGVHNYLKNYSYDVLKSKFSVFMTEVGVNI